MLCNNNNKEATDAMLDCDGWLHTGFGVYLVMFVNIFIFIIFWIGDIARFDETGLLYILDRCKELIKYKGFQIAPAELEALILTMPQVTDVVVIPVVHEEAGEVPRAYVVPKAGTNVSEDEIIKFVESKVTHHKKLRGGVKFTDVIPKSASGKILRRVQILKDRESSSTK